MMDADKNKETVYSEIPVRYLRLYNKMGAVCWLACNYKAPNSNVVKRVGDSGSFPIGQSRTIDLSKEKDLPEGALVTAFVGVCGGYSNAGPAWFTYSKNSQAIASYTVTGTTLHNGVIYRPEGYYHDKDTPCYNPDWMGHLSDDIRISEISMVGTHDSMAFYGGDILVCQTLPLEAQLNAGIRALDIRCKNEKGELAIYHNIQFEWKYLSDVLNTVINFLNAHPTETVLMRLCNEESKPTEDAKKEFDSVFYNSYWSSYEPYFWKYTNGNNNPKLSEVRGKIVLLPNFSPQSIAYGITWGSAGMQIQDAYELKTNWELYSKWEKVKEHLDKANGNTGMLSVNFLSGAVGSFPYFVASGQSSPETGGALLLTGMTDRDDKWLEFPRVLGSIAFEGTNNLTVNRIRKKEVELKGAGENGENKPVITHSGIIMCDFPGADLINTIIALNRISKQV